VKYSPRSYTLSEQGVLPPMNERPIAAFGRFEPDGLADRECSSTGVLSVGLVAHTSTVSRKTLLPGKNASSTIKCR